MIHRKDAATKSLIYQSHQIQTFERIARETFKVSAEVLMQRAGRAAFDFMIKRWAQAQRIAVFCGGGNNGGDGYVLALHARERGLKVTIWQVSNQDKQSPEARNAKAACQRANIPIKLFLPQSDLDQPDVVVDAICGLGLHPPLSEIYAAAVDKINELQVPVFAIDIPTGVDADTGQVQGSALRANATMTFIGYKLGLLTGSGVAYAGEVVLNTLQLPSELFSQVEPIAERVSLNSYTHCLKPRSRDWHKGMSGHVLVIGGALGFSGAPRMAAEAALRTGAGLVSVATLKENALVMNIDRPELMCHGISKSDELNPLLEKADVVILGPGLGESAWAKSLLPAVFDTNLPLVVDADGLNLLAQTPKTRDNWVLTPHPGEAARLLGTTVQAVQQNRLTAIKGLNSKYGGVSILKGAGTLIYAPDSVVGLCDKGNPGMASAGMGDVLSGVIGALIGQGIPLDNAAKLGVCLHAVAGDLAARDGERGMVAMDLMPFLRRLSNLS